MSLTLCFWGGGKNEKRELRSMGSWVSTYFVLRVLRREVFAIITRKTLTDEWAKALKDNAPTKIFFGEICGCPTRTRT